MRKQKHLTFPLFVIYNKLKDQKQTLERIGFDNDWQNKNPQKAQLGRSIYTKLDLKAQKPIQQVVILELPT